MKASKFSDAQKAFILKQGADGVPVAEICRKAGISQATYFNWKKRYDGMTPPEMRRMTQLEDENAKLRKLVADLSLDREMLQDIVRRPEGRRSQRSEAWSEAQARRRDAASVGRVDPQGLPARRVRYVDLPLPLLPTRPGPDQGPHERDRRDTRPVRLPTRPRVVAAGGLAGEPQEDLQALQGVGPTAAEQDPEATCQGEAARGSANGPPAERSLGHGVPPRPAGDRPQDQGTDGGRHVLALLPGA